MNNSSIKNNNSNNDDRDNYEKLPIREEGLPDGPSAEPKSFLISPDAASLSLEPVPDRNGLLVKIQPPKTPSMKIPHVPCDIVLVIDISGSMSVAAPVPGEEDDESTGLSVLDLTKHAARTIVETMDENDRLGIVTFATKTKVLQPLIPMTDANKDHARAKIKSMVPRDATNLWQGLLEGIKLFNGLQSDNVPAVMILTDGMPNHMYATPNRFPHSLTHYLRNPAAGFVPKIRAMGPLPASIHTFGFGYYLRSGLLKSIAEIGGGNYAFIPDAGMIGTVFVHAVANLQSTFATNAVLKLTYSKPLQLEETTGASVEKEFPKPIDNSDNSALELTITLGNLQYAQSRDIYLNVKHIPELQALKETNGSSSLVSASLSYAKPGKCPKGQSIRNAGNGPFIPVASVQRSVLDKTDLAESEIAYHESRSRICAFISSIFPMLPDGEHEANKNIVEEKKEELLRLIEDLPAKPYLDEKNISLMQDLSAKAPEGQIYLAVESRSYFNKWGCHFLPSLLNAHTRQICNSFKDPGPLQYGTTSPLFKSSRDLLDKAFDNLPAPAPSITRGRAHNGRRSQGSGVFFSSFPMSRYRNSSGVCFAGSTAVTLASGRTVPIRKLRRGVKVCTPKGPKRVALVLKTLVEREVLCWMGKVLVTPWHPVSTDGSKTWVFPARAADAAVLYTGYIYSVLLERDTNSAAHAIQVGDAGVWGVTLGHGLTSGGDARAHAFFGDYNAVGKGLVGLERTRKGVVVGGGVERDGGTGLVRGFKGSLKNTGGV